VGEGRNRKYPGTRDGGSKTCICGPTEEDEELELGYEFKKQHDTQNDRQVREMGVGKTCTCGPMEEGEELELGEMELEASAACVCVIE
jgi:hypothetical protein